MKGKRKIVSLILCMTMLVSMIPNGIVVHAESWNEYLGRVYQERYQEFLDMRAANTDNNVPAEEVWTGNETEPKEDADGDGLLDIYTAAQFRWALTHKRSMELMNDVDLGARNNVTWTPVADPGNITIEGNGYTVYNMNVYVNGQYGGMIASTARNYGSGFEMRNIRFRYCYNRTTGQYSGTVIGWMGGGKMKQVSVEDSVVYGAAHTGGIMSAWNGTGDSAFQQFYVEMDQCHVRNITVYGTSCVGSFVGPVSGCKVTNSYSIDSYDISTTTHSGGFISCPGYCWVENCFTNVKLYCNSDGGVFAGICHLGNHFENCFSAGVVEGTSNIGGFYGRNEAQTDTFINCYSTSMVGMQNTATNMGGFYGGDSNSTARGTNCYSAGEVGTTQTTAPNNTIAGFGGTNAGAGRFSNCYYDKQTSGMGEYAISSTTHTAYNGITGYLTGQMIGDAMKEEFGEDNWVYQEGMYPQLAVFANANDSFGNETDQAIARAYSAASVCTALLQPSNLGKTQEELENYGTADYDTVRNISVLFPLTNDDLAGYGPDSNLSISWKVRDGYTCQLPGVMNGLPVITISPETYEVTNFAPGVGWVDVSVDTGITNPQNGKNIVGQRFMRLVPTTVISLASSAGVDRVIYVANDERLEKDDISYDHRDSVVFAAGRSQDVDTGAIKSAAYPAEDTTFGYQVTGDGDEQKIEMVGVDLSSEVGGKAVVVVSKLNPETGKYEELNIAADEKLQQLLLQERDAEVEDIGTYRLEYRWYTTGNLQGGYITNSKTLTVRHSLKVSYDWNHPDHEEDSQIYKDDYPYTIGSTVNDAKSALPEDPSAKGYTFMGWSTDPDADPDHFEKFTADTELKDDTVVYAIWKINTYDVSIVKNGRGTLSGTGSYDYKDTARVTWEPEDGWYTNYVTVDGVIRDDLLSKNEYVFENIDKNHTVYVEFGKEPRTVEEEYYQVTTTRTGGDATCKVSNSVSAKAGEDTTITWSAGEEYTVTKVLIDGKLVNVEQQGSYTLSGINQNHTVEVVFEKKSGSDIHVDENYSTVTTSKQGNGTVSASASVENRTSHTVTWTADPGSHVAKVIIDGIEYTDEEVLKKGRTEFSPVEKDHTVEVIFEEDPNTPPVDPDTEVENYVIETSLVGGPGTISPGQTVEVIIPEENPEAASRPDITVDWNVANQRYKIKEIYVDGVPSKEEVSADSKVDFKEIDSDHKVVVVLEPNLFEIQTMVEGEGTITPGASLFWGENYEVNYEPAAGWQLKQIYVDTVAKIESPDAGEAAGGDPAQAAEIYAASAENNEHALLGLGQETRTSSLKGEGVQDIGPISFTNIEDDHVVHVVYEKIDGGDDTTVKHTVTTSLSGGVGSVTQGAVLADGSSYTVSWEPETGYEVDSVIVRVNGVAREGLVDGNQVVLENLSDDMDVQVILRHSKTVTVDGGKPDGGDDTLTHTIFTSIEKGAGTISPSMNGVAEGSSQTVYWTFGEDSAIRTIYVDGVVRDDLLTAGEYTFENVTKDHRIDIYIKEDPHGTGGVVDKDSYRITTSQSGQGEVSDSSSVTKGDTAKVTWKPAKGYQVSKVVIDGVEKEDLISADGITFESVGADHSVYVEFARTDGGNTPTDLPKYHITTSLQGDGMISSSAVVEKGENKTVSWSAKDGSSAEAVIVDGIVRDDLLTAGEYRFRNIEKDHTIEVLFKKDSEEDKKPDGGSSNPEETYLSIKTITSGQGSISGSKTLMAGDSYTVSWKPAEGWKVAGVIMDGLNADSLTEAGEVTFDKITANHTIKVIFVPEDGSNPGPAYLVETDITGGEGTITATGEVLAGRNHTITWEIAEGYEVAKVLVDGVERPDLLHAGALTLEAVSADHRVQVILQKIPDVTKDGNSNRNGNFANGNVINSDGAKTGDESPTWVLITMLMSMGVLIVLFKTEKKRKIQK
ncbi:MAG: InlB B-repeat-containing protein [Lachnospiraceae bacterium]|jgi:uncharacterized repeat protein (TIGR02543 family)